MTTEPNLTSKICLRCDWHGDTPEPACPDCGARPLYVARASRPRERPAQRREEESTVSQAAAVVDPPRSDETPSSGDEAGSGGRPARVLAPLLAAVVLTATVGMWLGTREDAAAPTASAGSAAPTTPAGAASPTPTPLVPRNAGDLVRIDAVTGQILATIPIPDPDLVASDGRSVWVFSRGETTDLLVQIDAAGNGITRTVEVDKPPQGTFESATTALAAAAGIVWIGDETGGVYRLAPDADAFVPATLDDPLGTPNPVGGSLVGDGGAIWVSWFPPGPCCSPPPDLYRVDPTGRVISQIDDAMQIMASGEGFLWALVSVRRQGPPEIVRIDTEENTREQIELPFEWTDLTAADGSVWASSPQTSRIVRIDPLSGIEQGSVRVEGSGPLAAAGGAVWTAISEDSTIARYDIESERIETIDVDATPIDLVAAGDSIWVTVSRTAARDTPSAGSLSIGRHPFTQGSLPFSFNVPSSGWESYGTFSISKSSVGAQEAEAVIYWTGIGKGEGTRPCGQWWGAPDGTIADFAAHAVKGRGIELVVEPSEVIIGTYAAQQVVFTVREDVACNPGFFYRWKAATGGALWTGIDVGDTVRVWLVDIDGSVLYIEAATHSNAGAGLGSEINQIVKSMSFG